MKYVMMEEKGEITYIYLNRPDKYNALNKEMLEELLDTVRHVRDSVARVVVLSGKGSAFCSGGDIRMMEDFSDRANFNGVMETIKDIVMELFMMPKIIISAIQGAAVGLGLSIALTADYVVTQKDARLGMLFLGIGLLPDGGGHFFLQERIGVQKAKQFIWGMEQVKGIQAKEMGLVDILSDEQAIMTADRLAEKLLSSPLTAMLKTKMLYHSRQRDNLLSFLVDEQEAQWELRQTQDHQEGVQAFLDKRKPRFKGE
ncbi:enoyl-CoA hydratase [Oceanobacillus manasiensis]|uniref:enoyl-CoA hydratase n=1 Tax=Oceanobacillus manasiensis TaxID=586413 RepID=UPI0005A640AC|nr:enoyl-CoA hydratase [Oceanobacillus manasiensis]